MIDSIKLIKLLRLTTSDQDGEALLAIRKANEMLKREKADWEQLIRRSFDKTAYQRNYMRRYRAAARARGDGR